jgi:hypothetical protein
MIMTVRNIYTYLIILFFLFSCSKNQTVLQPSIPDGGVYFVSDTSMKKMEGIYTLNSGTTELGTQFVCKASKFRVSFFSNEGGIFFILKYGIDPSDSSLKFSGFWRFSQTPTQGLINFTIPKAEALAFLKTGDISTLALDGSMVDSKGGNNPLSLKFSKPFSQYTLTHPFEIYAHHGVQTVANPPFAENSIGGVLNDEDYGVNGIEFDIQLTKDKVPICMHDAEIDIRLTQKSPLMGSYIQYNFQFFGRLYPACGRAKNSFPGSGLHRFYRFYDDEISVDGCKGGRRYFRSIVTCCRKSICSCSCSWQGSGHLC